MGTCVASLFNLVHNMVEPIILPELNVQQCALIMHKSHSVAYPLSITPKFICTLITYTNFSLYLVVNQPHSQVRENLTELRMNFSDLLIKSMRALLAQPNINNELPLCLKALCVDVKGNIPLFDDMSCKLYIKMDVKQIMMLMTDHKVWDPINFNILGQITRLCAPDQNDLHDYFEQHKVKVQQFQQRTFLIDYMAIVGSNIVYPPGWTTITVKFERKYNEYTMARFAKDQGFLAGQFLLQEFVLHFKNIKKGCVSITWFIPKGALQLLSPPSINEKREALRV